MSFPFNPLTGIIPVTAEVIGPLGNITVRLALDTGATYTFINAAPLVAVGYDPALVKTRMQVTTASGLVYVPQVPVLKLKALGLDRINFPVVCHTLPPSATTYGLLGLDFLRGQLLSIDFRAGQITLT